MLKAGAARKNITPPIGAVLQGYAPRISTNIHDDITATALYLEYEKVKTVILGIMTAPVCDEEVDRIRKKVCIQTGLCEADVTVCASQTHSAPAVQTIPGWGEKNEGYCLDILEPAVIDIVKEAKRAAKPSEIGIGAGQSMTGINRRQVGEDGRITLGQNPWGPFDPEMTVIRFRSKDSAPIADLVHYGAHPTSIGATGDITRDWPGIVIDSMERHTGCMTMFLNGAVGDVGPRLSNGATTGDLEQMYEVGNRAAFDAIKICKEIKDYRDADLEIESRMISLPYRPLPSLDTVRQKLEGACRDAGRTCLDTAELQYWKNVKDEYDKGDIRKEKVRLQTITRLGPVILVPFSGEPFAQIVLRLKTYSPFQHSLCLSTTNGSDGYYATRDSLHRGGYEVEVAKAFSPYIFAEDIDDVLIREHMSIIRAIYVKYSSRP